jgi:hypothetical protein
MKFAYLKHIGPKSECHFRKRPTTNCRLRKNKNRLSQMNPVSC